MLLGSPITHFGAHENPASLNNKEATPLFIATSVALMIAVNVRIFGTLWALLMVALCVAILYMGRMPTVARLMRQPILIALPCFFVLSCMWSDVFTVSLSLGLQTLLVTLTAIAIAECMTPRQFLLTVFLATAATCIGCLLHGGLGPSESGLVLIGFLGSKDAMGLFAYLGFMTSMAVMLDRETAVKLRLVALIMAMVELYIATTVHAATAVIALMMGVAVFAATYVILSRFKMARWMSYFSMFLIIIMVVLFGSQLAEIFLQLASDHLGKDATLTGRTLLWQQALMVFEDSPLLGHGYRAFWVSPSLDARRLLYMMRAPDGRGFHFHQQYLEVLADTGIVGFAILLVTFAVFTQKIWKSTIVARSYFTAYSFAILFVYLVRWFLETAFLPFSFDMMMLYGLATLAMKHSAAGDHNDSSGAPAT